LPRDAITQYWHFQRLSAPPKSHKGSGVGVKVSTFPVFPSFFLASLQRSAFTSQIALMPKMWVGGWCIKVNPGISSLLPLKLFHTQTPKMASTRRVFKCLKWLLWLRSSAGRPHLGSGFRTRDSGLHVDVEGVGEV